MPAWDLLGPALANSFKLAFVAFLICVPLSILGGVIAGLRYGKATDRGITIAGISFSAMPEFVSGIVLILVFAIWLGWLPVTAQWEEGAGVPTQVKHLLLPALTLTLVLFGYIARVARAGMIEALDSDYARTAYLKGLPHSVVVRKHILRNALLPTIAVVAVQVGYLVGGLVAVEYLFNYQGLGPLILEAARQKDLPLLVAGVLVIGIVYLVVTLVADVLYALLNPRIRLRSDGVSVATRRRRPAVRSEASVARSERLRLLAALADGGHRRDRGRLLGLLRAVPRARRAVRPDLRQPVPARTRRRAGSIRSEPTRTGGTSSRACSPGSRNILMIAPAATLLGTVLGTMLGLITGLPARLVDDVASRFIDAILALPLIVTAILIVTAVGKSGDVGDRAHHRADLRAGRLADRSRGRARARPSSTTCRRRASAASARRTSCSPRSFPNVMSPIVVEFTVRLGYAIFAVATLTFLGFGVAPPSPDWAAQINQYWTLIDPYWWMTFFPALAIASLVVGVNLVADGVREVYER